MTPSSADCHRNTKGINQLDGVEHPVESNMSTKQHPCPKTSAHTLVPGWVPPPTDKGPCTRETEAERRMLSHGSPIGRWLSDALASMFFPQERMDDRPDS